MGSGLNKIRGRVNYDTKAWYKEFAKRFPNVKTTYKEYIDVIHCSNEKITDYILDNQTGFKLPSNLGTIGVTKFKQKSSYVVTDWVNSIKQRRFVPLLNLHSLGFMFKIRFFRNKTLRPLRIYNFKAHRLLNRRLAQRIKSGKDIYVKLESSFFNNWNKVEKYLKVTNG